MTEAYVYLVKGKYGGIKIGFTHQPFIRIKALQSHYDGTLRLLALWFRSDAAEIEAIAHHEMRASHIHGEFFDITPQVAIDCLVGIMRRIDDANFIRSELVRLTPSLDKEGNDPNNYRIGYCRDFCETPLIDQRKWLIASGAHDIFEDVLSKRRCALDRAILALEDCSTFLTWSPDILGGDSNRLHLAASFVGARVVFAIGGSFDLGASGTGRDKPEYRENLPRAARRCTAQTRDGNQTEAET